MTARSLADRLRASGGRPCPSRQVLGGQACRDWIRAPASKHCQVIRRGVWDPLQHLVEEAGLSEDDRLSSYSAGVAIFCGPQGLFRRCRETYFSGCQVPSWRRPAQVPQWLRVGGLLVWGVVGGHTLLSNRDIVVDFLGHYRPQWLIVFLLFGFAYWVNTHEGERRRLTALVLVSLQSAIALGILFTTRSPVTSSALSRQAET